MSDENRQEKGQPQVVRNGPPNWVLITVAIIGAAGVIIAALITVYGGRKLEIKLIDAETRQGIPGTIFIDNKRDGINVTPDNPTILWLKRGNRSIRAESNGYKQEIIPANNVASPRIIAMEKIATVSSEPAPIPLSMVGWHPWQGITMTATKNECVINSNGRLPDAGGFNKTSLNTDLRGRTLILYFSNTAESSFSQERMIKLEYNTDNKLLRPTNASLISGEYLPAEDTLPDRGIEYKIPDDFDGKLEFAFYQANLNDLRITAYYK